METALTPLIKAKLGNSGEFIIFVQYSQRFLSTLHCIYVKRYYIIIKSLSKAVYSSIIIYIFKTY